MFKVNPGDLTKVTLRKNSGIRVSNISLEDNTETLFKETAERVYQAAKSGTGPAYFYSLKDHDVVRKYIIDISQGDDGSDAYRQFVENATYVKLLLDPNLVPNYADEMQRAEINHRAKELAESILNFYGI